MSPEKTSAGGWYRLDRVIEGVGRIRKKSGKTLAMHNRVEAIVNKLLETGQLERLREFQKPNGLTAMQLVDADRRNGLADQSATLLAKPLFTAIDTIFPAPAEGAEDDLTTRRYRVSLASFKRMGLLRDTARVRDLAEIDWPAVNAAWPLSDASWNHLQRALSRFLSLHLGKHSQARNDIVTLIPVREELERLVELTPEEFRAIIKPAPIELQHCFWTLAITGLRAESEYHKLTEANLGRYQVRVLKSKVTSATRIIPVDLKLWHHVVEAVPCAFHPAYLSRAWRALAIKAKRPELWLRDLRHCFCFWSLQAGMDVNAVREAAGHKSLATTQKYLKQLMNRDHAAALATKMLGRAKARKRA